MFLWFGCSAACCTLVLTCFDCLIFSAYLQIQLAMFVGFRSGIGLRERIAGNEWKWRIWMFPLENPFNQLEQALRLHPNNWTSRANTLMLVHVSEFRELFIAILEYFDVVDVREYAIHVWTRGVDVFSCGRLDVIDGLLFWCLFSLSSGHRSFGCCLERAGGCPGGWGDARSGLWAKLGFCEQKMGTEPEGIGYEHVSTIRSENVNLN